MRGPRGYHAERFGRPLGGVGDEVVLRVLLYLAHLEPGILDGTPVVVLLHRTTDARRPQVDVAHDGLGELVLGHDVGDSHPAAGLEHPRDLAENGGLVVAEVDDPVADENVDRLINDRRLFDVAFLEAHVREAVALGEASRLGELLFGHVDTDDLSFGSGVLRREERIHA